MMPRRKLVIGTGKTGKSCINFFQKKKINFKVFDTRKDASKNVVNKDNKTSSLYRFQNYEKGFLNDIEEVIISPGMNPKHKIIDEIKKLSIPLITDIELWHRYSSTPVIAVTGTNGKTTTVSMLEHLLNKLDFKSIACGNNGVPILESLNNHVYRYLILELSSYQLEYASNIKTFISLVTNVEDDHFDRHEGYKNYLSVKKRIFLNCDYALCNINLKDVMTDIKKCKNYGFDAKLNKFLINGKVNNKIKLDNDKIVYGNISINFKGLHNLDNLLGVLSISEILNINMRDALSSLSTFKYPTHRIQLVKKRNNVCWYNDSKSTNPSATIAAIKYAKKNILLILGGSEKLLDYTKLNPYIDERIKLVIFIGENRQTIRKQLTVKKAMIDADSIHDAVEIAHKHSHPGDSILLSPASSSFDMFVDYEERGMEFIKAVNDIIK